MLPGASDVCRNGDFCWGDDDVGDLLCELTDDVDGEARTEELGEERSVRV